MQVRMDEQFLQVFSEKFLEKKLFLLCMKFLVNFGIYINENFDDGGIECLKKVYSAFLMMSIIVFRDIL